MTGSQTPSPTSLRELALLFLRLGTTAFGGPAAHIAMMQDEVVRRRQWMTDERFLDLLAATNLIPGPNSTEMAGHIGWARRRWAGLIVAGLAFVLPATLITTALASVYVLWGALPSARWLLYGVKPVVLAVVVQAIWILAPKAARTKPLVAVGIVALLLAAYGVGELAILLGAGGAAVAAARIGPAGTASRLQLDATFLPATITMDATNAATTATTTTAPLLAAAGATSTAVAATVAVGAGTVTLPSLFLVFLKIGSVLFGSGYVLLAFLRAELVQRLRWLTEPQLLDAIAVGQITPGPLFTSATFVGCLLAGPAGALVATAGIFLPAFVFVAVSGPLVPRLRASPAAASFLDGVQVASLALMVLVTAQLARAAVIDLPSAAIGLAGAFLLLRFKLNSTWLVLAGAIGGLATGWAAT